MSTCPSCVLLSCDMTPRDAVTQPRQLSRAGIGGGARGAWVAACSSPGGCRGGAVCIGSGFPFRAFSCSLFALLCCAFITINFSLFPVYPFPLTPCLLVGCRRLARVKVMARFFIITIMVAVIMVVMIVIAIILIMIITIITMVVMVIIITIKQQIKQYNPRSEVW